MTTTSLPLITTERGQLTAPTQEVVDQHEIAGGFVLTEQDLETTMTRNLHVIHRGIAARLLLRSGVLPSVRQIDEYPDGREWGTYTALHIDGLMGRFIR